MGRRQSAWGILWIEGVGPNSERIDWNRLPDRAKNDVALRALAFRVCLNPDDEWPLLVMGEDFPMELAPAFDGYPPLKNWLLTCDCFTPVSYGDRLVGLILRQRRGNGRKKRERR